MYISVKTLLKILYEISHIAATDKILKTNTIVYYTLNVFDHSSGPLQSKIITSYQFKDKLANEQLLK